MWPEGFQRREQVVGQEDELWATSNFVWHSNGHVKHSESTSNNGRAELRRCLGVFRCEACRLMVRPHTKSYKAQLNAGCPDPCGGSYTWLTCDAKTLRFITKQNGIQYSVWEHLGSHKSHPRPPGGRLSLRQRQAVDQQVLRHHDASAYQLRTGDLGPGSVPLPQISPSLANA
jgi:hypothetical protein